MFFAAVIAWITSFVIAIGIIIIGFSIPNQSLLPYVFAALFEWAMLFGYGCILDTLDMIKKHQEVIEENQEALLKEVSRLLKRVKNSQQ